MRASITVALVGIFLAGLACSKRERPPFSSSDQRWQRVAEAARPTLAVTELGTLESVASLVQLAERRRGLALTCAQPAPPGTRTVITAALALAKDARSRELHAVIYLSRLLRQNGSGLISLMLGSYVARKVVDWAKQHGVTAINTPPLQEQEERRALAADALCVWQRFLARGTREPGKTLRGYLEVLALSASAEQLREHQEKAFIYQGDYPALTAAPRGYDKYLSKARTQREAFNALAR